MVTKIKSIIISMLFMGLILGSGVATVVSACQYAEAQTQQVVLIKATQDYNHAKAGYNHVISEQLSEKAQNKSKTALKSGLKAEYQTLIQNWSKKYNLDPLLVEAVIMVESKGKADTISSSEDYGLMQINKINHEWLGKKFGFSDFLNPNNNIHAGCYLLKSALKQTDNNLNHALMVYNMGYSGAKNAWDEGRDSTEYSKKVIAKYSKFKGGE